MYKSFMKRVIDIVLSACGLIVLLPVFLILAIAVVIDDPGSVFLRRSVWTEKRAGRLVILNCITLGLR